MKQIKPLPPVDQLNEWFSVKGSELVWKTSYFPDLVGKRAGYLRPDGYTEVRKHSHKMLAHRIVYCMTHNQDPGNFFVDHIDGNPTNNAPSNLRIATQSENMRNVRRLRSNNKSGHHGVSFAKVGEIEYWRASVCLKNKTIHLGSYGCKEAAIAAREVAERFLYGDFTPICLDRARASFLSSADESEIRNQTL